MTDDSAPLSQVVLLKGKEKKIRNGYPFIFRDETGGWEGRPRPGDLVRVVDYSGGFVGYGYANPKASLCVRVLTLNDSIPTIDFWINRIRSAVQRRQELVSHTSALRWVHAEADGCPGLIIDRIGDYAVLQSRTAGTDRIKAAVARFLLSDYGLKGVIERSDMPSRADEDLEQVKGVLAGSAPEDPVIVDEQGLKFYADLLGGHKTGFYADQRDNRATLGKMVTSEDRVLDLFCYNGGFSMAAARTGARVLGVDLDPAAIGLAIKNAELNGFHTCRFEANDVFSWLETAATLSERYTVIIIDPPAMAKKKAKADNEKWMFWRLVNGALKILTPGGRLVVSSCAYHLSQPMLAEAIRIASNDVNRLLRVQSITFQPDDHPWVLQIPESMYLKTFFLEDIPWH
ncbi:MAG: class I SAM-dependent rRNA methyltransferase [Bacteroidetes bacterium]|nr:class I SAM-dependent rRNA methyltransferase [Bacteroidota bacterium]